MSIFYFSKFSSEYNSSNFGDDINPELLGRLFSKRLIASENVCILGVGTILNDHNIKAVDSFKKKVIFSSGVGYGAVTNDLDESWDVVCVRGPKSAEALKVGAEKAVCDGAILLSDYYEVFPESCRCISVTFIPHLKTHWSAGKALKKITQSLGINYLSPDVTQVDFIKQVSQSKLVITEAMHGAILADTMRVPWLPIQIYEHNRFKWEDWFQSINQNYSSRKMNVSIWNSPKSIVKRSIKAPYQAVKSGLIAQQISQWASSNEAIMSSDALLSEKKRDLQERVAYINEKYEND
ncbi:MULTISPECIES: polysaccharide pyruvyl transferase family protein [unclassified Marinobacter]|jgi:succinoglycan biosynthesis protein ExoV|uniref:polysaccharide pyruvyl transferase family protein n=1 Tax=unclassified Marinobacter TaxID=83889 RepID=UPI00200DB00E|nr:MULTISPECIES: polysaccharide pyruvyl transferase family protein [unclassified Marinobacter]UQG54163.1 polysaccharide pyruvyl transferase family protein [Marinobacter sp. M4C]UQG62970.1 polysaccharide pyruvyl transferase family protein [Marinobacter sp. M2C]UQG67248.1 polysaccharide pyruvyl transferase family protein [Marinobacter sp. M1C]